MSLYQKIKSAITVRQVGEMYGMEPDRHGMVCCPFHSDSDPSMKLNDTYYYCFGCGAKANAIALPPPKRGLTDEQWADIAYCLRVLTDYLDRRMKKLTEYKTNFSSFIQSSETSCNSNKH